MQKIISFRIDGNQEDPEGNPIPYVRVVSGALWLPKAKRYAAWKEYVRNVLYKHYPALAPDPSELLAGEAWPLTTKPSISARMDIKIAWMNGIHGDPDNIFKGIADALFQNDKFLDGSFESFLAEDGRGKVDIEIVIDYRNYPYKPIG